MLQQTQVATVVPYFRRFLDRFPTIEDVARAAEQDVLRLWQGLGYYSRARNLHATAKKVVSEFGGTLPTSLQDLLSLPGIGRYTAGAIVSIAFDQPAPIVDGNVTRVICRLDGIRSDPRDKQTRELLWQRAEEIVPKTRPGDFNSALMELGATVCIPRNPQCLICPVSAHCQALASGLQEKIPVPRKAKSTPLVRRHTYCIHHADQYLIEQRPARGRWASMWQFITVDPVEARSRPIRIREPVLLATLQHALTHRRYEFDVFAANAVGRNRSKGDSNRRWVRFDDLDQYPMPRPHVRMIELLERMKRADLKK
jgi:A/G-specific adenine glycosylase